MTTSRRGPFRPGDHVQITDPKGRQNLVLLEPGRLFYTHRGSLAHDELIGSPEGSVVRSSGGTDYVALRPLLADFTLSMTRGAAVVYPKDAAQIVAMADIFPGASVLEAGAGSGALACWLLRAVGEGGLLVSYERRPDFAEIARGNVERFFGGPHPAWQLRVGSLPDSAPPEPALPEPADRQSASPESDGPECAPLERVLPESAPPEPVLPESGGPDAGIAAGSFDRMVLDMLAPWECVTTAAHALIPGGVLCCYVATVPQLSKTVEALRAHGGFYEPAASENLTRGWHADGLAVRPDHRMVAHTGFLVIARRLAPGTVSPPRRRRPAKAATDGGTPW